MELEASNVIFRRLIREILDMPAGSVRPIAQEPSGPVTTDLFATVQIADIEDLSTGTNVYEQAAGNLIAHIWSYHSVTFSVNFYNGGCMRAASRLVTLLKSTFAKEKFQIENIVVLSTSNVRDLSEIEGTTAATRAQIDIVCMMVSHEVITTPYLAEVTVSFSDDTAITDFSNTINLED